jgi:hypothetical protein
MRIYIDGLRLTRAFLEVLLVACICLRGKTVSCDWFQGEVSLFPLLSCPVLCLSLTEHED